MTRSRRRLLGAAAGVLAVAFLAWDGSRPPAAQATARLELALLARYRATLSPLLSGAGVRCRFTPTCSRYAEAAIRRDGALRGTARSLGRLLRCGPWTAAGTVDPP
jgi:putative membrane protein insertion efficiency factor